MMGISNAGKTTILNGIIVTKILSAHKNEFMKKGVLIKHLEKDYPVIRKTRFKHAKMGKDTIYYFGPEGDIIAIGIKNIHRILGGTNMDLQQRHFFYEIDTNIKFVNDSKLDKSLKEKICFIDLLGFFTNNNFEKQGIYANLMKSFNIILI